MEIDFTLILLVATAVTGMVVLGARLLGHDARAEGPSMRLLDQSIAYARAFFPVIAVVVLVRAFIFEPFRIPSASMMPGLVDGDFILVEKFAYGLRLPLVNLKFLPTWEPRRGDVIVFRLPSQPSIDYIKRLVGLPGDHVLVHDNQVYINGRAVPVRPVGVYEGGYGYDGSRLEMERFRASRHLIMLAPHRWVVDFDGIVPAGHYFFMGDNRNDSEDSRFPMVGFVPDRNLVGRAVVIWMNWRMPGWPHLARIGTRIR